MLYQTAKECELDAALRAVIQLLFMRRAVQVLIQSREGAELAMAKVAFERRAVPGSFRRKGLDVGATIRVWISEQALCDHVIMVNSSDSGVDFLAGRSGDAGARF